MGVDSVDAERQITKMWLREYNEERLHDSLGRVPTVTFMPRPTKPEVSNYKLCADGDAYAGAVPSVRLPSDPDCTCRRATAPWAAKRSSGSFLELQFSRHIIVKLRKTKMIQGNYRGSIRTTPRSPPVTRTHSRAE